MNVPIQTWPELRDFAVALYLPKVEDAVSWGNPNLKAHGKMWCWWSPYVDAAIFKGSVEEREMLMQADPETFILHDHYANYGCILVAAGRIERDWVEARLRRTWRDLAPKRWLAKYDAEQG
ncbi:MmcQ/YjbR family DNA-binding protein [Gymnodinialimonas sp.]